MMPKLALLLALVLAVAGCGKEAKQAAPPTPPAAPAPFGPAARPQAAAAEVSEAVKGNNAFACALYAKLAAGQKDGNLFFSPFSVSTALGMTCAGARGSTAAEMRKALCFTLPDAKLHPAMGALLHDLNAVGQEGQVQLSVANALWGQQGHQFLPAFLALDKADYGAGLETVDFAANTEAARKAINAWVEKQTQDKIRDLVQPGVLDKLTRLVLTNAIYFKGGWEKVFDPERTRDGAFKLGGGNKVEVPMMQQTDWFNYAEGDGFHALELTYKGKRLGMLILLPDKDDGLAALEKKLSAGLLGGLTFKNEEVDVKLPRFTMTSAFRLDQPLKSLGMATAFDCDKADFSGVNGVKQPDQEALYIAAVLHKAFVEVNEKGTEAAAATAVKVEAKNGHEPKPFLADHPFLFAIRDRETKIILFLGRVVNPKGQ